MSLQPTDVGDDLLYLLGWEPLNRRHAAKLPVVGGYTELNCSLESKVRVVARLVDLVDQGRTLGVSRPVLPVARGATALVHRRAGDELERCWPRIEIVGRPGGVPAAADRSSHQAGADQGCSL